MAPRLSWTAAALAGCAVVAVAASVATFPGLDQTRPDHGARDRYWQIRHEVRAEELRLQVQAAFDSVAPLLVSGTGLTFAVRVPLPPEFVDSLRAALRSELGNRIAPKARIGVFVVASTPLPGEVVERAPATYQLRGSANPEPTCAVVASVPADRAGGWASSAFRLGAWSDSGWVRPLKVLGGCRLWARYGAPGRHVGDWLVRRGYALAELDAPLVTSWSAVLRSRGTIPERMAARARRSYALPEYGPRALECRSGNAEACTQALFGDLAEAEPAAATPALADGYVRSPQRDQELGPAQAALLAGLEHEFGTERFARFWTSPDDVATAFQTAFGVTAAQWLPGWLERQYGPLLRGPAPSFASTGISLLVIAALFGAALATARARQR